MQLRFYSKVRQDELALKMASYFSKIPYDKTNKTMHHL